MKRLSLVLLFTAFVSLLCARDEVKIGAIYSFTGPNAFLGGQMRDGALLRMRELNSADNDNFFDYTLIFEDDAGTPAQTVLAYKKLTQIDKVDVVFSAWAGPGNAVAPLAAHDKILNIGCSWDGTTAADELAFIHLTPPAPQAKLMAETLSSMGIKRVAVLCMVQQGFIAMKDCFEEDAKALGIEVKTTKFNPGETNFRTHLLKLRPFEPDMFLVLTFNPEFEIAVRRIEESFPGTPITAVEGFSYASDMTPYAGNFFVEGNYPTDEFKEMFVQRTGKPLATIGYNAIGYDMVDLTMYAYETAGKELGRKPTTAEAAAVLRNLTDYPSAIGSLSADENGIFQSPAVLKYINEDGSVDVLEVEQLKEKLSK